MAATAAVLAGGRSLRMGTDKALLPLEGKPMVVRQVELLQTAFERVLVVTNSE
ncbi:MAG: NTP transferase domain-containing protein, partial [Armatimonadetes bacterium]|nr:NTP transferase domain-containing protein [Armatimonadota bacterium]